MIIHNRRNRRGRVAAFKIILDEPGYWMRVAILGQTAICGSLRARRGRAAAVDSGLGEPAPRTRAEQGNSPTHQSFEIARMQH